MNKASIESLGRKKKCLKDPLTYTYENLHCIHTNKQEAANTAAHVHGSGLTGSRRMSGFREEEGAQEGFLGACAY